MPRVLPDLKLSENDTYIFSPEGLKRYLEIYHENNSYEWALDALIEVSRNLNNGFPEEALNSIKLTLQKYANKEQW